MIEIKEYIRGDKHVHEAGSVMIKVVNHGRQDDGWGQKEAEDLAREFAEFEEVAAAEPAGGVDAWPASPLDGIFHKAVNTERVKAAIGRLAAEKGWEQGSRLSLKQWFIVHKVLEEIDWFDDTTDRRFIMWVDDVFGWSWKTRDFKSVLPDFKRTHSTAWNENTVNDPGTGRAYRCFADEVRGVFVSTDRQGRLTDRAEFLNCCSDGTPMFISHRRA